MLADILAGLNVCMGLVTAFFNWRFWRASTEPWRWIKLVYAGLGLVWAITYILAIILYDTNLGPLGPFLARPLITVTLASMAAGAMIRAKS